MHLGSYRARPRMARSIVIATLGVAGAVLLLLRPGFGGNPPDLSATGSWLLGVAIFTLGAAAAQVISLKRAAATPVRTANPVLGSDTQS